MEHFDVSGRVVIITGGGRGLGRAMAMGLASRGCRVAVCGRTKTDLVATADEIEAAGGEIEYVVTDLANPEETEGVVEAAARRWGAVDVVINNAVDPAMGQLSQLGLERIGQAYAVNVFSPLRLCQAALAYLERSEHASIINVLSVYAWWGGAEQGLYASSKAALLRLTKIMAHEWSEKGVRVNGLALGPFETSTFVRTEERQAWLREHTLLKRVATADEIVPPVLFLASDASRYMTGAVLTVDGGMTS
jgi:3-oxoacyl-[acyl-carrier protein] reductase